MQFETEIFTSLVKYIVFAMEMVFLMKYCTARNARELSMNNEPLSSGPGYTFILHTQKWVNTLIIMYLKYVNMPKCLRI